MKLSHHSRLRFAERTNVDKKDQKNFFKQALTKGKSKRDFDEESEIYNYLFEMEEKGNCKIKLYKDYVFIHSKNGKTLYTIYEIPKNIREILDKETRT